MWGRMMWCSLWRVILLRNLNCVEQYCMVRGILIRQELY